MPITSQMGNFFVGRPSASVTIQVPTAGVIRTFAEISIYEYMPPAEATYNRATAAISQIISASGVENFALWPNGVPMVLRSNVTSITFGTTGAPSVRIGARWMTHFYL